MTNIDAKAAENKARELLPCEFEGTEAGCCVRDMGERCASCERRPAVAAELQARDEEIERLKIEAMEWKLRWGRAHNDLNPYAQQVLDLKKDVARLEAENAELRGGK